MTKDIKDYTHYYLGCEVMVQRYQTTEWHKGTLCEVTRGSNHGDWIRVRFEECVAVYGHNSMEKQMSNFHSFFIGYDNIKLLLRPLFDMKHDELQECGNMLYDFSGDPELNNHRYTDFDICGVEQFHYLLSKHFDVFELIEAGLAIDKTKLMI